MDPGEVEPAFRRRCSLSKSSRGSRQCREREREREGGGGGAGGQLGGGESGREEEGGRRWISRRLEEGWLVGAGSGVGGPHGGRRRRRQPAHQEAAQPVAGEEGGAARRVHGLLAEPCRAGGEWEGGRGRCCHVEVGEERRRSEGRRGKRKAIWIGKEETEENKPVFLARILRTHWMVKNAPVGSQPAKSLLSRKKMIFVSLMCGSDISVGPTRGHVSNT